MKSKRALPIANTVAFIVSSFIAVSVATSAPSAQAQVVTFANPIVRSRDAPDPWVIRKDGFYYFTATTGGSIYVWKSATLTGIDNGLKTWVWSPPATGANSRNVWAPELHFIQGKWYIYYAADDGDNKNHRMYVLEAATDDPQGTYINRGKISAPTDRWAIDGTVLEKPDGSLYFLWSGWDGFTDGIAQNIYIAQMSNPYTISGERVLISAPHPSRTTWEWWINEAPEVLQRDGKTFIVYSANGSFTPRYCLGMLMNTDGDFLNPASWTKSTQPVFYQAPNVFGPGHNSFTKSPDGMEDWFVYHATDNENDGWNNRRPRAQRLLWSNTGVPLFGYPVAPNTLLEVPSGEAASNEPRHGRGTGLTADYYDNKDFTARRFRRHDASVNFTWGIIGDNGAPAASMQPDTFSIRWQGEIEPKYSENYTFRTYSDDGVRLFIDGQLVLDNWTPHFPTLDLSGSVRLEAGRRHKIQLDYFEEDLASVARLEWSSASQPLEVIPRSQLYPLPVNRRASLRRRFLRR